MATSTITIYIDDASDADTHTIIEDDTIEYTVANASVGARISGSDKLNGCLSEMYFQDGEFLYFTIESNRRKFISSGGKPVDLQSDGSGPTGTQPIVYFSGATVSWHTNDGNGGSMTETGELTDCGDSPSD